MEVLVWDSVGLKLDVIARDHRLLWPINAGMLNETQILAAEVRYISYLKVILLTRLLSPSDYRVKVTSSLTK